MSSSTLRSWRHLMSGKLYRPFSLGTLLIGFGYGLSFDQPLSYLPYGIGRSYEYLSEALPGLRDRRLSVYHKLSKLAERWKMESPFLNAYLLDRICRETVTRQKRFKVFTGTNHPQWKFIKYKDSPMRVLSSKQDSTEIEKPIKNVVLQPQKKEESLVRDPSNHTSSTNSIETKSERESNLIVSPMTENTSPQRLQISDVYERVSKASQKTYQRMSEALTPSFFIAYLQDLLFSSSAIREPSFVSVMDRVHHLTTFLEPHCTNVERLRSVYITIANLLYFTVQQESFYEQLFRESSLEHDRCILQFFHTTLLATHRMEYLNEYERLSVTPAPPSALPTGRIADDTSSLLWKTALRGTTTMKGLVSNFNPSTNQKIETLTSSPIDSLTSVTDKREIAPIQRPRSNWTPQTAAADCRQKIRNVWNLVGHSHMMRNAVRRVVWKGDYHATGLESKTENLDGMTSRSAKQIALESHVIKESEEVVSLTGAVRSLVQEFNKNPATLKDSEVCFEMNKGMQTPLTLNPFGEQYSPYRLSNIVHWIIRGPLIPFMFGATVTAMYLAPSSLNKDSLMSRLWTCLTPWAFYDDASLPLTSNSTQDIQGQYNPSGYYMPNIVASSADQMHLPSSTNGHYSSFLNSRGVFPDGSSNYHSEAFLPPEMSQYMQTSYSPDPSLMYGR